MAGRSPRASAATTTVSPRGATDRRPHPPAPDSSKEAATATPKDARRRTRGGNASVGKHRRRHAPQHTPRSEGGGTANASNGVYTPRAPEFAALKPVLAVKQQREHAKAARSAESPQKAGFGPSSRGHVKGDKLPELYSTYLAHQETPRSKHRARPQNRGRDRKPSRNGRRKHRECVDLAAECNPGDLTAFVLPSCRPTEAHHSRRGRSQWQTMSLPRSPITMATVLNHDSTWRVLRVAILKHGWVVLTYCVQTPSPSLRRRSQRKAARKERRCSTSCACKQPNAEASTEHVKTGASLSPTARAVTGAQWRGACLRLVWHADTRAAV